MSTEKLNDTRASEWNSAKHSAQSYIYLDLVHTVLAISGMRGWNLRAHDFNLVYLNAAFSEEMRHECVMMATMSKHYKQFFD